MTDKRVTMNTRTNDRFWLRLALVAMICGVCYGHAGGDNESYAQPAPADIPQVDPTPGDDDDIPDNVGELPGLFPSRQIVVVPAAPSADEVQPQERSYYVDDPAPEVSPLYLASRTAIRDRREARRERRRNRRVSEQPPEHDADKICPPVAPVDLDLAEERRRLRELLASALTPTRYRIEEALDRLDAAAEALETERIELAQALNEAERALDSVPQVVAEARGN